MIINFILFNLLKSNNESGNGKSENESVEKLEVENRKLKYQIGHLKKNLLEELNNSVIFFFRLYSFFF